MNNLTKGQEFLDSLSIPLPIQTPQTEPNPFKGMLSMEVTRRHIQSITDAKFAWLNLIVQGHMMAICAQGNGGKTTIMVHAAGEMSMAGYHVIYVNADASASDIKEYTHHAMDFGYKLINPDITNGSPEEVVTTLHQMSGRDFDYSKYVLILDTLKKFTDMMNKKKGKELYAVLRALTSKGMTIICLAHTNKYDDKDGKPIFEGVGDLRNDFDELVYLIPKTNPDDSMTVSTSINKKRADLKEYSFQISPHRDVTILDEYIDTGAEERLQREMEADKEVVAFILSHTQNLPKTLTDLTSISKDTCAGFSRKRLGTVLRRYSEPQSAKPKWEAMRALTSGIQYKAASLEEFGVD